MAHGGPCIGTAGRIMHLNRSIYNREAPGSMSGRLAGSTHGLTSLSAPWSGHKHAESRSLCFQKLTQETWWNDCFWAGQGGADPSDHPASSDGKQAWPVVYDLWVMRADEKQRILSYQHLHAKNKHRSTLALHSPGPTRAHYRSARLTAASLTARRRRM